tara:strand:+ start:1969 stop:3051 length:1083 start_codon:yes stop_codon:yes gene_type:complete
MKKLLFFLGTRPEGIKMAPLINTFRHASFITKVCNTGQHKELLDQTLNFFDIKPDFDLAIMSPNQSLEKLTSRLLISISELLDSEKPDLIFVHGDTTTSFVSALSAFYKKTPIAHIEAGLRTNNKFSPFPEEINRVIVSRLADFQFAPTELAKNNLLKDGIDPKKVFVTGNTVIDALFETIKLDDTKEDDLDKLILITGHRRENFGIGFKNIFSAIKNLAVRYKEYNFIYPVHPNPNVKYLAREYFSSLKNVTLIPPVDYPQFVSLMKKSYLIITDSGGIQEEAPSLGKPVIVTRDTTERPEAVASGTVILVGNSIQKIEEEVSKLIDDKNYYNSFNKLQNPYGDGTASIKILNIIKEIL